MFFKRLVQHLKSCVANIIRKVEERFKQWMKPNTEEGRIDRRECAAAPTGDHPTAAGETPTTDAAGSRTTRLVSEVDTTVEECMLL